MNCITTNCTPTTPDNYLENDSHYFTPAKAKVYSVVQFCDQIGINYFGQKIFCDFNIVSMTERLQA